MPIKRWWMPGSLLLIHLLMMGHAAQHLSPTWDEIVYPVAGVTLWKTHSIKIAGGAPFFSELLCALPLLPLPLSLPQDKDIAEKDQTRIGYEFTFHNTIPAQKIIFRSRLPSIVFSLLTALLLFLWIRSLWGESGALASLLCFVTTPLILSRANLALLEMPAYFFALLALCLHERGSRQSRPILIYGCGVATGLALLCKMICAPLVLVFFILQMPGMKSGLSPRQRLTNLARLGVGILMTVGMVYLPWHDSWQALRKVSSFTLTFTKTMPPYYWHGQNWIDPPSLISWAAMILKAPLFVWGLSVWGFYSWWVSRKHVAALRHLMVFLGTFLIWPLFYPRAVSTIQFSLFYLALVGLAGGIAAGIGNRHKYASSLLACLVVGALVDGWHVHPNYLAYFNPLAGGPDAGYRWLSDSDQDWGQALPPLADYLHAQGDPNVLLAYSGSADPRAYGIRFQDLLSPALYSRETQGEKIGNDPRPVWVALSTKVLQSEPALTAWLRNNVKPQVMIGSCFFIYDVTRNAEAFRWMGYLYVSTRRPAQARWAFERAQALDPGQLSDQQALRQL